MKPFLLTLFALVAFALNSILCRMALRTEEIDAASFTAVRIVSGSIVLCLLAFLFRRSRSVYKNGSWSSALFLFTYAVCFSFAYMGLSAGTGALILFCSVQLTMIGIGFAKGDRPSMIEWLGLVCALGGLLYLTFPGLTAPPLISSFVMAIAGAAWGLYSLKGKAVNDPLTVTAGNFVLSVPFAAVTVLLLWRNLHLSSRGIVLAVVSGAIASGIGYTIWYTALKYHTSTRAAILQLAVPVIAAIGGVVLLNEAATLRLIMASALILGGIAVAIAGKKKKALQN